MVRSRPQEASPKGMETAQAVQECSAPASIASLEAVAGSNLSASDGELLPMPRMQAALLLEAWQDPGRLFRIRLEIRYAKCAEAHFCSAGSTLVFLNEQVRTASGQV
mmetsp:Transcript_126559/g.300592  ORF Transcript_126559/g.300592 Transcript_126559/m.300592 type:complete len:107 (-) Transcript_126559:97-417(-)